MWENGMQAAVNANWFTKGFSTFAAGFCKKCVIWAANNATGAIKVKQQGHLPPDKPFNIYDGFYRINPIRGE